MYGMNAGYLSLAEACGETEPRALSFIPGEDFDPSDEFDVEAVGLAMENDMYERQARSMRKLHEENYELKIKVVMLENDMTRDEAIEAINDGAMQDEDMRDND